MKALFNAFDESENDIIMIPLKFSILVNGNESLDKSEMLAEFEKLLTERLVDSAGFEEIDDDPAPLGGDDEDEDTIFRFKGSLDLMAYMLDKYGRRDWCQQPQSVYLTRIFDCCNKAEIFKKLASEDGISADSFRLLTNFLAQIPIKSLKKNDIQYTPELTSLLTDAYRCVQLFYLTHDAQHNENSTDALLNLAQLNHDNYVDYETFPITPMTQEYSGQKLDAMKNLGILSDDMRIYADDIIYKKK